MIAKGQVVDSVTGDTLPGATIAAYINPACISAPCNSVLLGGTSSDLNGMFNLNVPQGTSFVQVSYVGYQKQVPVFQDGILQRIHLVRTSIDTPIATATAKRTYNKYYVAAAVAVVLLLIWHRS